MSKPLVPDELWTTIEPLLPRHKARRGKRGRPPVGDRAALTGVSSSSSRAASPGTCCPRRWAAARASPAGGGCGTGSVGGSGRSSWSPCSRRWRPSAASTSPRSCSTASRSAPFLGGADRAQPHGPGQMRHETPSAGRPQGYPAGPDPHGRQPARFHAGVEADRRDPARPQRPARPATASSRRSLRGPGLWHAGQPPGLAPAAHPGPLRAAPRTPHGSGLGRIRQVVERALCWIGQARRLKIRYEKLTAPHRALHYLQMARMCCRIIQRDF